MFSILVPGSVKKTMTTAWYTNLLACAGFTSLVSRHLSAFEVTDNRYETYVLQIFFPYNMQV